MNDLHLDAAGAALGSLDPQEKAAFHRHLTDCGTCAEHFTAFTRVVDALDRGIGRDGAAAFSPGPSPDLSDNLAERVAASRKDRTRRLRLVGVAAAALIAAGPVAGVLGGYHAATRSDHGSVAAPVAALTFDGSDAASGAHGVAALTAKGWGTDVRLDLAGVTGPRRCRLVAVSESGEREVVAGWSVPKSGYGVPGSAKHLQIQGGTGLPATDLNRLEVETTDGHTLLTIRI